MTTSASATGPANHSPVRPMPVCTSSSQSSAPLSRVISRAAARYAAGGTTTPASPWMGSRITAAVSSVTALASAASSPYGTKVTSPGSGSNGVRYASFDGQRERAHGAAVEGTLGGDQVRYGRCAG